MGKPETGNLKPESGSASRNPAAGATWTTPRAPRTSFRAHVSGFVFRPVFLVVLTLLSAPLFAPPSFAQSAEEVEKQLAEQRKELDAVRARLQREQKALEALRGRKTATVGQLKKLEDNIRETNRYLAKLEETERKLAASVRETRGDLRAIEGRLKTRSEVLARRARLLYMSGRPEDILFVPGLGESDFLRRAHMTRRLIEYDRRLLDAHRRDAGLKQEGLKKLLVQSAELEDFQKRKQREMATFTSARDDQQKTLRTLQRDEEARAKELKRLEENARKLDAIIRALEKRRQEAIAKGRKGRELETGTRYCAPVQGRVVSRYGLQHHETLKTTTRNLGIEIAGAAGASVRAAVTGEVAMVTEIPGYGPGVILDNGSGYFTIYANLGAIRVAVGDVLNTCQDMASLAASPGTLYFEVRRGTKTLDPEGWLKGTVR